MNDLPFAIHPDAAKSFDERAEGLRALVRDFPPERQPDPVAPPVHISAAIGENDIVGEVSEGIVDYRGNAVTRFSRKDGRRYGFTPEDYRHLRALARAVLKQRNIGQCVSQDYAEQKLVAWVRRANEPTGEGFCTFLSSAASEDVKRRELLVPIANLQTTEPLGFGKVTIETISKEMIDALGAIGPGRGGRDRAVAANSRILPAAAQATSGVCGGACRSQSGARARVQNALLSDRPFAIFRAISSIPSWVDPSAWRYLLEPQNTCDVRFNAP